MRDAAVRSDAALNDQLHELLASGGLALPTPLLDAAEEQLVRERGVALLSDPSLKIGAAR